MATSYGSSNGGKASYSNSGARLCCACHKNKVTPPGKKCQACKNKTKRAGSARRAGAGGYHSSSRCSSLTLSSGSTFSVSTDFYASTRRDQCARDHDESIVYSWTLGVTCTCGSVIGKGVQARFLEHRVSADGTLLDVFALETSLTCDCGLTTTRGLANCDYPDLFTLPVPQRVAAGGVA